MTTAFATVFDVAVADRLFQPDLIPGFRRFQSAANARAGSERHRLVILLEQELGPRRMGILHALNARPDPARNIAHTKQALLDLKKRCDDALRSLEWALMKIDARSGALA